MVRWNKQQTVCCEQRAASHPFEFKLSIIIVQKLFIEHELSDCAQFAMEHTWGDRRIYQHPSVHRVFGGDHYRGGRVKCPLSLHWFHVICLLFFGCTVFVSQLLLPRKLIINILITPFAWYRYFWHITSHVFFHFSLVLRDTSSGIRLPPTQNLRSMNFNFSIKTLFWLFWRYASHLDVIYRSKRHEKQYARFHWKLVDSVGRFFARCISN